MTARHGKPDCIFGGASSVELLTRDTVRIGENGMTVELARRAGPVERVELPPPKQGFGGSELVVAPDQQWAALFVYSGQSEQGWELFELEPKLRHAGGLPMVQGEGMAPAFSPDSRYIAMAVTAGWVERDRGRDIEEALDPKAAEDEGVLVDWGVVYFQRIREEATPIEAAAPSFDEHAEAAHRRPPRQGGPVQHVAIGTRIPRTTEPDALYAWRLDERLHFVASDRLALPLPWGEAVEIQLPATGPVTTGPSAP